MAQMNRRIVLASRPSGEAGPEHFRLEETPIPQAASGEVLLKTLYLSLDPYMRGRMSAGPSYAAPVAVGETMVGGTVCEVVESKAEGWKPGDVAVSYSGWQEYSTADVKALQRIDPRLAPPSWYLGILGMPGLTAYTGLLNIGQPKAGETLVVAAASGAVGAVVGQIARIKGCRVVGVAGGKKKCEYVTGELGFDACVDHNSERFKEELKAACPKGIDIYFENVGGKVLAAVVPMLNDFARVPVCGLIAHYNDKELPPGPDHVPALMLSILVKRLTVRGFIVTDFASQIGDFLRDMGGWLKSGQMKYREDMVEGLENTVPAFLGMLHGKNFGKLVVHVSR